MFINGAAHGVAIIWLTLVVSALSSAFAISVLGHKSWSKGLSTMVVMLLLMAMGAILRMATGEGEPWSQQTSSNVLFSVALSCLMLALRQFRQLGMQWWQAVLAPVAVLLLGLPWPFWAGHEWLRGNLIAAVWVAQALWVAMVLWSLRALRLGIGHRMMLVAVGTYIVCMPLRQLVIGRELALGEAPGAAVYLYWFTLAAISLQVFLLTLGFMRMVQDRREARSRRAALRDPLTRMLNRRALTRALEHCLKDAVRQSRPLALLLIDVDHFKRVNDTYGHISGDRVLRHVSRVLASNVRADSFLGRFGGEEFVVVCPDTAMPEAQVLADRLNRSVHLSEVRIKGHVLPITVSIGGFAGAIPQGTEWESVLEVADSAMYQAKNAGRDRVVMMNDLPPASSLSLLSRWMAARDEA